MLLMNCNPAQLADGRVIGVPLAWSWRLSQATQKQRKNFEIMGNGEGVHWPDIDEDIMPAGCSMAFRHVGRNRPD